MADVRKPRARGFQFLHQRERLLDVGMRGMRNVPQRVEDEIVKTTEQFLRAFRHAAEIRQIGRLAESESQHGLNPMHRRNRHDVQTKEIEWTVDRMQVDERESASGLRFVEDVRKLAPQDAECVITGINRYRTRSEERRVGKECR